MLESTDIVTNIDGVPVRKWIGTTENGIECIVFVHRIAVLESKDSAEFEAELKEQLPPGRRVPLSMIL